MTRLFPEVLASFATGCQGWQWHEDAWRGQRIAPIMQPLYEEPPGAKIRMQCNAGVRLRFTSDTTKLWIQLRYGVGIHARPLFKCDVLVDGKSAGAFGPDEFTPQWEGVIFESREAKERTFDIWLCHTAQVDVVEIRADENCLAEPAQPLPVRWLMYGDSITQGMVSSLPTKSAFGIAALELDAEVFNLAIGGARLIAPLADTVPGGTYDLISIAYGTNDFNKGDSPEIYQANARSLLEKLLEKFPQTPILLITPITWASRTEPNVNGNTLDEYRQALQPLTELSSNIRLIDGTTLVPDDEAMFVDKVHPNDAGFAIYGRELAKHAKAALEA